MSVRSSTVKLVAHAAHELGGVAQPVHDPLDVRLLLARLASVPFCTRRVHSVLTSFTLDVDFAPRLGALVAAHEPAVPRIEQPDEAVPVVVLGVRLHQVQRLVAADVEVAVGVVDDDRRRRRRYLLGAAA